MDRLRKLESPSELGRAMRDQCVQLQLRDASGDQLVKVAPVRSHHVGNHRQARRRGAVWKIVWLIRACHSRCVEL